MLTDTRELFRPYSDPEEFEKIIERDSVSEMWEGCVREYADKIAIVDSAVAYTYAQLERDAAKFRTVISEKAFVKPARIGILATNSYDFVKAFIAITTLGHTAVVLPVHLDASTVYGCCLKYDIMGIVYQSDFSEKVGIASEKLRHVFFADISRNAETGTPAVSCAKEEPCLMMFTGGTTGKNKCALLSNGAVMQGTVNGCYGVNPVFYQRYLLVLPLTHVFGLIRNLLTALYTGSTVYICGNNKNMFREIAACRPTMMVMVPALAEISLTLSKQFKRNMLGDDLKYIVCGAAAVSPYLIQEYGKMGIQLLQGYGLTESANLVAGNPESLKYPEAVGYPYPNQELKIVDGELWLKGKNMMDGYVVDDGEDVYEDGWFKTGDLVRFGDNGMLYITGRKKEIIILSNGENISPAEVEAKFNAPDFIQASQVFEDVTEDGRHILALEVVPRYTVLSKMKLENPKEFIISELGKINLSLPSFQRVSRIAVRDSDFERTPGMKMVRYQKC